MSIFTGMNGSGFTRWDNKVTIPWKSLSRMVYPRQVEEVLAWAEELWLHHGLYAQAIKKAVRYFMTEIEIYGEDLTHKVRRKYAETLADNFDIMDELANVGDDLIALGNAFTSVYVPFQRDLECPHCFFRAPYLKLVEEQAVHWEQFHFAGTCPVCRRAVAEYNVHDVPLPLIRLKPRIIRWPPQYMQIRHMPLSGNCTYRCDITRYPELYEGIKAGDATFLAETPWEFIEALQKQRPLEFADNMLYHLRMPQLSVTEPGLRGWGLPLFMNEFETAILVLMLDKYTEAIAVDYLVPFRVLAPPRLGGQEDPLVSIDMSGFMANVRRIIDEHRQNPTTFHTVPFPLEYQTFGGEAGRLAPVELLQYFEKRLLHSMGIPEEFQSSNFQTSGPLIAFSLFERQWQFFANLLNKWSTWLLNRQGQLLNWESAKARLLPVSVYEDPEIRQIKLQLASAREISRTTALRSIGIDYAYEQDLVLEEEQEAMERQTEISKDMENRDINMQAMRVPSAGENMLLQEQAAQEQAAGGAAPAGGASMAAAPGGAPMAGPAMPTGSRTLDELMATAEQMANELLTMEPTARRSQLVSLKKTDPTLHAQVSQTLGDLEQQAKSMGVQQARAGQAPPM